MPRSYAPATMSGGLVGRDAARSYEVHPSTQTGTGHTSTADRYPARVHGVYCCLSLGQRTECSSCGMILYVFMECHVCQYAIVHKICTFPCQYPNASETSDI